MALNLIKNRDDPDTSDPFRSLTIQFIYRMLSRLQQKQTVFDYLQVDRVFYTAVISVDPDYRGQRLSEKLLEKSLDYAEEKFHIRAAYTETTSQYSLKAFLKMGYRMINEMMYVDYDKEKLSNMGVHDRCSLVARKLD